MASHSQYQHRRRGATTPVITAAACGEDKPPAATGGGVPAAEYPCVRRSRQRRLLTFLWLQGYKAAFGSIAGETGAFFSVPLLRELVEEGKWADARGYLSRFLPLDLDTGGGGGLGLEAQVLHWFLYLHGSLASIVDGGGKDSESVAAEYKTCLDHGRTTVDTGVLRISAIILNALHAKQYFRTSLDWERVRRKASEIVDELAYRTAELKELVLMPGTPMKPHNVLPIGFGLRPRYRFKKQVQRPRASTLANRFLLKKRPPVSSNNFQESHDELLDKARHWAADAIDDCLKAGKRQKLHQESPFQPSANKSAPCNLALQMSTVGTLTNHAMQSLETSSMRRTGAPVAPVYQTMYGNGNMTGHVRNPSVPILANANILANPMLRTPAAPGAPFAGNMFRVPFLQTTLPNHVLTPGAPSSATMFHPPVSRTVYGRLTNPDKSSGISLMTSAGTNKHPSQENIQSSQQALNPEIHPRAELTTSNDQDLDLDRKPATEA